MESRKNGDNWIAHLEYERDAAQWKQGAAIRKTRDAELEFSKLLHPENRHTNVSAEELDSNPKLRSAREKFREAYRGSVRLTDEVAGFEVDIESARDD